VCCIVVRLHCARSVRVRQHWERFGYCCVLSVSLDPSFLVTLYYGVYDGDSYQKLGNASLYAFIFFLYNSLSTLCLENISSKSTMNISYIRFQDVSTSIIVISMVLYFIRKRMYYIVSSSYYYNMLLN